MLRIITIAVVALFSSNAMAGDLQEQFTAVCKSKAVKSDKLIVACEHNEAPDALKSGDRFKAVGIGAEVNTLAANLAFFKS